MIKTPKGFSIAVAEAGIKYAGRTDMALIYSENIADLAATYTSNKVKAAPVIMNMVRTRKGKAHAVLINSGNANACTAEQGMQDARQMASQLADALKINDESVFVCSTGVIGVKMPMGRIKKGIISLADNIGKAGVEDAAKAIMTTDTFPKTISRSINVEGTKGTIVGIAKGAGMIEPNMATMLCFILTDLAIENKSLKAAFSEAVEMSFNRITVDGDQSTSDTAMVLANGAANNEPLMWGSPDFDKFKAALTEITYELSHMIVKDGEGATKVIEVRVTGARSEKHALKAARAIANSLLFKTAMYGEDPNWGRILAVLGRADIPLSEEKVSIKFGNVMIVQDGLDTGKRKAAEKVLSNDEVVVTVDLASGLAEAKILTCDITENYIKINAEYTT